jgi:hypothetical protein
MDLSLLGTLKEKLAQAARFSDVLDYFLTHFGEKSEFIALGERTRHPFLESILAQIGGQIFSGNVVVTNLILTQVAEQQFVHGGCAINGCLATVIYFDDVQLGLLSVVMPPPGTETKLVRFSGRRMPRPSGPSIN